MHAIKSNTSGQTYPHRNARINNCVAAYAVIIGEPMKYLHVYVCVANQAITVAITALASIHLNSFPNN